MEEQRLIDGPYNYKESRKEPVVKNTSHLRKHAKMCMCASQHYGRGKGCIPDSLQGRRSKTVMLYQIFQTLLANIGPMNQMPR